MCVYECVRCSCFILSLIWTQIRRFAYCIQCQWRCICASRYGERDKVTNISQFYFMFILLLLLLLLYTLLWCVTEYKRLYTCIARDYMHKRIDRMMKSEIEYNWRKGGRERERKSKKRKQNRWVKRMNEWASKCTIKLNEEKKKPSKRVHIHTFNGEYSRFGERLTTHTKTQTHTIPQLE